MSQNALTTPTTGTVSGLALSQNVNKIADTLASNHSGPAAPAAHQPGQFWLDASATPAVLKIRNTDDSGWTTIGPIDSALFGALLASGGTLTGALNEARATVASHATAADIWAAAGNSIDWTGTATATTFPAAPQAGAKRRLHCAGAGSFTHSATLDIVGNASFTGAAGDIVDVEAITTTTFKLIPIRKNGQPVVVTSTPNSEIRIDTLNSTATVRGSTNTGVQRFTTTRVNTGSAFSHVTNAADGSYVEILEAGIYEANGSFFGDATSNIASITKNSTSLTDSEDSTVPQNTITFGSSSAGSAGRNSVSLSATFYGTVGDRIRMQSSGTCDITAGYAQFLRIVKIG